MQHWNNYFLFCTFTWNFIKRIYLRYYTPLVEVNQAILAWSCRQKVISKQMMWSVSTRPQFFKAQPCCQNEIKKLDHSLSHILTHHYVLSLQRLKSNWPINGKASQNHNLHVTKSANQWCFSSWQWIGSRQHWQDSLGNIQTSNYAVIHSRNLSQVQGCILQK